MRLSRVYPIVDSARWVSRLLPLGVTLVQLRIKNVGDDELCGEILEAKRMCQQAGARADRKAALSGTRFWPTD